MNPVDPDKPEKPVAEAAKTTNLDLPPSNSKSGDRWQQNQ
jgi:hypothetical protein